MEKKENEEGEEDVYRVRQKERRESEEGRRKQGKKMREGK